MTVAFASISGSSKIPADWSRIPPESSMKNDAACVITANCR